MYVGHKHCVQCIDDSNSKTTTEEEEGKKHTKTKTKPKYGLMYEHKCVNRRDYMWFECFRCMYALPASSYVYRFYTHMSN